MLRLWRNSIRPWAYRKENIAFSIAESASSSKSLVALIDLLERQKKEIERQIDEAERLAKVVDVTEEDIRYHYGRARAVRLLSVVGDTIADKSVLGAGGGLQGAVEIFPHVFPSFCGVNHEVVDIGGKIGSLSLKGAQVIRKSII